MQSLIAAILQTYVSSTDTKRLYMSNNNSVVTPDQNSFLGTTLKKKDRHLHECTHTCTYTAHVGILSSSEIFVGESDA